MAAANVSNAVVSSKPSKWFGNKSLRISFHRRSSKSASSPVTSPTGPKRSTTKEEELREVFAHFDRDGDGKISAVELRSYFGSIGEHISHEDAQGAIEDLDADGDSFLDFQDFLKLMNSPVSSSSSSSSSLTSSLHGDDDDDLKRAFEMFEYEKGSGCITPKGLQRMLQKLGDNKSYEECVAMIQFYDVDGNGVLDFHEFNQMMA